MQFLMSSAYKKNGRDLKTKYHIIFKVFSRSLKHFYITKIASFSRVCQVLNIWRGKSGSCGKQFFVISCGGLIYSVIFMPFQSLAHCQCQTSRNRVFSHSREFRICIYILLDSRRSLSH